MYGLKVASIFMAALILGFAVPLALAGASAAYAEPVHKRVQVGDVFTIVSKRGVAIVDNDGDIIRKDASLILTIRVVEVGELWFKFKVEGRSIEIDGEVFPITSGEGGARIRIRPRIALIGLKGETQDGVFHLRGAAFLHHGRIIIGLRGPLHVDDTIYRLRFLAIPEKQAT